MRNYLLYGSSLLLILAGFSLIFYLHSEREQEAQQFNTANQTIHKLINESRAIDSELLRVLNFRRNHFDFITRSVKQLRHYQKILIAEQSLFQQLPIDEVHTQVEQYLQKSQEKLKILEHLKSRFASYKNTLRYIPTIADTLKLSTPSTIKEQINALQALVFSYSMFPEEQTRQQLLDRIDDLELLTEDSSTTELINNLLFHTKANLSFRNGIQSLYKRYKKLDAANHLLSMEEQLTDYIKYQKAHSYSTNNVFLAITTFLLTGLLFGIHHFRLERNKVAANRNMFNDALESINESFAIYDKDDRLIKWNKKFEQLYPRLKNVIRVGMNYQELVEQGLKQGQFICPDISKEEARQLMLVSHKESLKNIMECLSGERYYLANHSRTSSGGIASVHIDITERRKMEIQLVELSRAVEQSPASVIITDTSGNITYVNPKFEQITGYSSSEILGQNPRILKSGHTSPEEYQQMWQTIQAGMEWNGIFHNKKKNGDLFWEQAILSAIRDSNQNIIAYLAIKEDITQRMAKDEQLRMSAMVFETSLQAIVVTDANNTIKLVNPSFEKITGYSASEVIGKTPAILKSGRHDGAFYKALWNTLYSMGRWQGEVWNRRKDGQVYPEWLSIALIKDDKGKVLEHVAVFSDISERKKAEDKIQWQANFDHLTQLPNRSLFIDRLSQFLATFKREQKSFALLFMDLDRFKVVNDTLGHAVGDELLKLVAKRLQENLAESDTIARFGGDEFTVLLPRIKNIHSAAHVAERLISLLTAPFIIESSEVFIGTSIGITIYPDDANDESSLIRNADMAMYHAKESGRNTYRFYTQSMNEKMLERMQLEKDLHRAIEENELFLEYQPVINPNNHQVVGAEALVRWMHPQKGRLAPLQFIPIAEETGLIRQLGEWVMQKAMNELAQWHRQGHSHLYMAINVSSAQRMLGLTAEKVQHFIQQAEVEPKYITLEITESLLIDHTEDSLEWLQSLKSTGLKLSIDDFGTGFSSLSYLRHFPVDTLKVDKSFVDDILTFKQNAKLVESIVSLAHNFDLTVVAEGVEEKQQMEFLQNLECDYIQGYYYSKPLSEKDFLVYITHQQET